METEITELERQNKELTAWIEGLIERAESLITRTRALDIRLLGKAPEVELGEITRMQETISKFEEIVRQQRRING